MPNLNNKASKQALFIHALVHYSHALPQLPESRAKKYQLKKIKIYRQLLQPRYNLINMNVGFQHVPARPQSGGYTSVHVEESALPKRASTLGARA